VAATGPPAEILTEELVTDVFGLACRVLPDPETGTPMVVPRRPVRGATSMTGGSADGALRADG
jgi:iron complex transport system ATP-binding protein